MSSKRSDQVRAKPTVQITFQMQDPHAITGKDEKEVRVLAPKGASLLEVAIENGINIEHASERLGLFVIIVLGESVLGREIGGTEKKLARAARIA